MDGHDGEPIDTTERVAQGFAEGWLRVELDEEIGVDFYHLNFVGRDGVKPTGTRVRFGRVISTFARGEIRGYVLVDGTLHLRLPCYAGPWPALDHAVSERLGYPLVTLGETIEYRIDAASIIAAATPETRGRADYAERVEARRERLENASAKAARESAARLGAARRIHDAIPFGQPILVGHHSEKRHRRDIEKAQANMSKGFEAQDRARDLARAADSVGTAGISSDDPEAVTKLRAELANMEASRDAMKAGNVRWRKAKSDEERAALLSEYRISPERRRAQVSYGSTLLAASTQLFAPYSISNLGANIRRVKARIEELSRAAPTLEPIDGGWYQIEARPDLNRIAITASRRLPEEAYKALKGHGWRWSPTEGAFLFHLNNGGIARAQWAHEILSKIQGGP